MVLRGSDQGKPLYCRGVHAIPCSCSDRQEVGGVNPDERSPPMPGLGKIPIKVRTKSPPGLFGQAGRAGKHRDCRSPTLPQLSPLHGLDLKAEGELRVTPIHISLPKLLAALF